MTHTLLVLAVVAAAPGPKDGKKDSATLVGEWAAESAVVRGKPDNPPPGTTWEFTADGKSILRIGGGDTKEGTYKADPKKDPAEVDISAGPKNGRPMKGLYRVEGDTLTLCLVPESDERPTKVEAPEGSKAIVITLKRVKKKD